jgi:hypothetical protein
VGGLRRARRHARACTARRDLRGGLHLPHILAFTLVAELAARPDAAAYFENAAAAFATSRASPAARPRCGATIALANRDALIAEIDGYGDALKAARALIVAGDGAALAEMFAEASTARRAVGIGPASYRGIENLRHEAHEEGHEAHEEFVRFFVFFVLFFVPFVFQDSRS